MTYYLASENGHETSAEAVGSDNANRTYASKRLARAAASHANQSADSDTMRRFGRVLVFVTGPRIQRATF